MKKTISIICMAVAMIAATSCGGSRHVTSTENESIKITETLDNASSLGKWHKCTTCNGKGACVRCKGTGKVQGKACPSCNGTGRCSVCDGKGGWRE